MNPHRLMHMRVAVKNHALPVFKKNRLALLLCIFETIICRLESYIVKRFKIFHEFLSLYDIWLVISFFQIGCKIERLVLWMSWCTVYVFWTLGYFLSKKLHLERRMLAGCKIFVMKFFLMNKEKVLRSGLPSHTYMLLRFDILWFKI